VITYCIRTDKRHELQFNLQGHLTRFGIQEYALVTGLRCSLLSDDNVMERVLDKMRLKDKYFKYVDKISCAQMEQTFLQSSMPRVNRYKLSLALIIEGVFNAPDNNVGIDIETLSIIDDLDLFFSYLWGRISYGCLIRDFFGAVGQGNFWMRRKRRRRRYGHSRRCSKLVIGLVGVLVNVPLGFSAGNQQNSHSSRGQPHIATLVPFDNRPVFALDDLARDSVAPQFHAECLGTPEESTSEDETSNEAHEGSGPVARRRSQEPMTAERTRRITIVGIVMVIEFDIVGRWGYFPPPTCIELLLPCKHRPPLMPDQLQRSD
ncbi:Hypothetical predicted protein, partial [Olea europaea subsp. europaea]